MAVESKASIKSNFARGDFPSSADFTNLIDSAVGSGASSLVSGATTARLVGMLGAGAVGSAILNMGTTAAVVNHLDLIATTAQMSGPTLTSGKFITPGLLHYHPLIPRAHVVFNGAATASITDSYNLASLGDLGTGQYRLTWGSAFANTNYGYTGSGQGNANNFGFVISASNSAGNKAVGDLQIFTTNISATPALGDSSSVSVWAFSR